MSISLQSTFFSLICSQKKKNVEVIALRYFEVSKIWVCLIINVAAAAFSFSWNLTTRCRSFQRESQSRIWTVLYEVHGVQCADALRSTMQQTGKALLWYTTHTYVYRGCSCLSLQLISNSNSVCYFTQCFVALCASCLLKARFCFEWICCTCTSVARLHWIHTDRCCWSAWMTTLLFLRRMDRYPRRLRGGYKNKRPEQCFCLQLWNIAAALLPLDWICKHTFDMLLMGASPN